MLSFASKHSYNNSSNQPENGYDIVGGLNVGVDAG